MNLCGLFRHLYYYFTHITILYLPLSFPKEPSFPISPIRSLVSVEEMGFETEEMAEQLRDLLS